CRLRISGLPSKKKREREVAPALFLSLLRELIFEPALQFGLVRMELDCVDFIHELLQLVGWNVVPHRFINPAENLVCGCRPDDSPRFTGSEWGSPLRSRWSAGRQKLN